MYIYNHHSTLCTKDNGLSYCVNLSTYKCTKLQKFKVFVPFIDANLEILTKEKGVSDVCKALDCYKEEPELVEAACSTLWSLSMEGMFQHFSYSRVHKLLINPLLCT